MGEWDEASRTRDESAERPVRSIRASLERVASDLGLDAKRGAVTVQECWREVVGDEVADHAHPRRLDEGVLVVEVADPAWATHIRYLGADLAQRLSQAVGTPVIKEVRVVVGRPRTAR